jgi:hypothetical protein
MKTTKETFDALKELFESKNTNRAIAVRGVDSSHHYDIMLLPLMQEKAEEEEKVRKDFRENESHIRLMNTNIKTCQKFSVAYVINMDTMLETVLYERKEGGIQPLPTLMKIHLTLDLILLKNSSSSQPSQVRTPTEPLP